MGWRGRNGTRLRRVEVREGSTMKYNGESDVSRPETMSYCRGRNSCYFTLLKGTMQGAISEGCPQDGAPSRCESPNPISACSTQLASIRRIALLRMPIILIRRIDQPTLILLRPGRRIVRQSTLYTFTSDAGSALDARSGPAQRVVALGEACGRLSAGADVRD